MNRAWTADFHLGHSKILEYCNRPFRDCDHMNERLIGNANMRLKDDDMCVHVGDFCVRGKDKYRNHLPRLSGHWSFLRGNHDKNNGVKVLGDWLFTRISHFNVFVSHIPYFYRHQDGTATHLLSEDLIAVIEKECDYAICGHVHDKWDVSFEGKIPCINIGVDVRKFAPVFDNELTAIYQHIRKTKARTR